MDALQCMFCYAFGFCRLAFWCIIYSKYIIRLFCDVTLKQLLRKLTKGGTKDACTPLVGIRKGAHCPSPENILEGEVSLMFRSVLFVFCSHV